MMRCHSVLSLNWLALFLEGVVGGAVGLLTLFYPPAAQMWVVSLMIVAWAFLTYGLGDAVARALGQGPISPRDSPVEPRPTASPSPSPERP